jgi:hypothetical protein
LILGAGDLLGARLEATTLMDFRDFIFNDTGTLTLEPLSGSELLARLDCLGIHHRLPSPKELACWREANDFAA